MAPYLDVTYIGPTSMMVISTLLPALSIVAVATRFYVRRKQAAKLLWDDWLLVPALVGWEDSSDFQLLIIPI